VKKMIAGASVAALLGLSLPGHAADIAAGAEKARTVCAACHGADGISKSPLWPNLRGQKEQYIAKQLKAFQADTRTDPLMTAQAKALSEADVANVAAYFASLK